jgi:cytochrome c-type biogenesis protein CcmH
MTSRRAFIARIAGGSAALVVGARVARAQQRGMIHDSSLARDTTNLFAMDQMAARPVQLPPKRDAKPSMTPLERDALERQIHCQCGCTLDVFTCRTTDFSCQVSPAMHRDVMALVEGGYGAQEIIDAFVNTYGERALMAPVKSGFNLLAWITPGIALVVGAGLLTAMIRRLGRRAERSAASAAATPDLPTSATPDELARLEAAVRGEDRS